MKLTTNYPIYCNPTFDEIVELASGRWDTCRILVAHTYNGPIDLFIASGFGNTHSSMIQHLRVYYNTRHVFSDAFILYYCAKTALFNTSDMSGGKDNAKALPAIRKYFTPEHQTMLLDLIQESELTV